MPLRARRLGGEFGQVLSRRRAAAGQQELEQDGLERFLPVLEHRVGRDIGERHGEQRDDAEQGRERQAGGDARELRRVQAPDDPHDEHREGAHPGEQG